MIVSIVAFEFLCGYETMVGDVLNNDSATLAPNKFQQFL